jgi:hypothetical protein
MLVHAAGESSPGTLSKDTFAFVLGVIDEKALVGEAARLLQERVMFVPIFEPDAPYFGQLMAIGIIPARKEVLKRHMRRLPLLK